MLLVLALAIMMLFMTMVFFMGMSRSIFGRVVMVLSLDFLMMFLFVMVVRLLTEIEKHVIIILSIELQGIDLFRSGQQCQDS